MPQARFLIAPLALSAALALAAPAAGAPFHRGDANDDGAVGVSDAVSILSVLFGRGAAPPCADADDANDDGTLDLSDAVGVLLHVFAGLRTLPPPSAICDEDPTADELDCLSSSHCEAAPHEGMWAWLSDRPEVRRAMVWWEPGRGWLDCDAWSASLRGELEEAFDAAWAGHPQALEPVAPNLRSSTDLEWPVTIISAGDAKSLHLSLVVQSLLVEIRGLVPWSMEEQGAAGLAILLDGRTTFRKNPLCIPGFSTIFPPEAPVPAGCQMVGLQVDDGWGLAAPGSMAFDFIESAGIGPSRLETIGNVLEWARAEMHHFGGSFRADVAEYYWGYRGAPPAARIIEGTDPPGFHPQSQEWGYPAGTGYQAGFTHWTGGCHGTTAFLRQVLRAVNIPVERTYAGGHALPWFLGDDVYLSHGDDPYNLLSKADYPARLLPIDAATYAAWYGDPTRAGANVGRQVKVLAAIHLPVTLLQYRCDDLAKGLPPESGSTYQALRPAYTPEDLAAMGFWERIDAAIAARGGCDAIH